MKDNLFYFNVIFVIIFLSILVILYLRQPTKEEFVEVYWRELPKNVDGNYTLKFYATSYFKKTLRFNVSMSIDDKIEKTYNLLLKPGVETPFLERILVLQNSTKIKVEVKPPIGQSSYIDYLVKS